MTGLRKKIEQTTVFLRGRTRLSPSVGLILGSGLGPFADTLEDATAVSTSEIPNYPVSTVEGHSGQLVFGRIGKTEVAAVKGRTHYYEGYSMEEITFSVRILAALGVKTLVVTNAAGGVNTSFKPGDLMLISEHINWFFNSPLRGINDHKLGPRFPDMEDCYSKRLIDLAERVGLESGIALRKGVYLGSSGPTYETPAEVRMFRTLGADAVGMSTVPEVIVAKHEQLDVLGITCITNHAAGLSSERLSHAEVTETANRVKKDFQNLVKQIVLAL